MPTLYVENVPKDLYEALRKRAKRQRRSISAEVLSLLEASVPTEKELRSREEAYRRLMELKFTKGPGYDSMPSSLDMIREDRDR
jgi:plasmid stability protein